MEVNSGVKPREESICQLQVSYVPCVREDAPQRGLTSCSQRERGSWPRLLMRYWGRSYAQRLWPAGGVYQHLCRVEGPKGAMGNLSQEKSPALGLGHQSLRPTPSTFLPGFQAQQGTILTSPV